MFTVNLDELVRVRFEVSTRPETFVPAGKATLPLTTTSLSSCVETRVPGASTDEMLCSVSYNKGSSSRNDHSEHRRRCRAGDACDYDLKESLCFHLASVWNTKPIAYWTLGVSRFGQISVNLSSPTAPISHIGTRDGLSLC